MKAEILPVNKERLTPHWMRILQAFIGTDGNKFAIHLEKSIEKNIIEMLRELDIQASVKSDRYSLPIHGVVTSSSIYSSHVADIFSSSYVKRQFLKILLNEGCRKVRFYVYVYTTEIKSNGLESMLSNEFKIEIRYYLHD